MKINGVCSCQGDDQDYYLMSLLVLDTYLLLLLIEVVNDHSNEEIQREERPKDNEEHKVDVHANVDFSNGLVSNLK